MKRAAPILLLFAFLSLGTGALQYLHNLQHAAEDAREDALAAAAGKPAEHHQHDESNCEVHAQILLAFFFIGWAPLVLLLGRAVKFVVAVVTLPIPRLSPVRIDCRGPPIHSALHLNFIAAI